MDYKFIILLVILLGFILFFTKEFGTLYKKLDDSQSFVVSCIDEHIDGVKKQTRNDLAICLNKIKGFNDECVKKVRKMDKYESQVVTHMSNHCTDSDDEDGSKRMPLMPCMSDVINQKQLNTQEDFYKESEDETASKKNKRALSKEQQEFVVNYNDNKSNKQQLEIDTDRLVNVVTQAQQANFIDTNPFVQGSPFIKQFANSPNNGTKEKSLSKNKSYSSDDDSRSNNSSASTKSSASSKENESSKSRNSSSSNNTRSSRSSKSSSESQSIPDQSSIETSDGVSISLDQEKSEKSSKESSKKSSKEPSKKSSKESSKEPSNDDIDEQTKETNVEENKKNKSPAIDPSLYETVTIGTRSKGRRPNIQITKSKTASKNIELNHETSESSKSANNDIDQMSIQTNDVDILTLDKLKAIKTYTIDNLKKIAKLHSIPLTFTDSNGTRKYFKREDLYNKIKTKLAKIDTK